MVILSKRKLFRQPVRIGDWDLQKGLNLSSTSEKSETENGETKLK